jgi:hypothetical protein
MQGISVVVKRILASREELCSMGLGSPSVSIYLVANVQLVQLGQLYIYIYITRLYLQFVESMIRHMG